jgi:hypothetical protein
MCTQDADDAMETKEGKRLEGNYECGILSGMHNQRNLRAPEGE